MSWYHISGRKWQAGNVAVAILLILVIVAASPCLAKKAKDESPESVLFWVSPDGDFQGFDGGARPLG
ncbi:hypothetical protein J7M28_01415, partial [bacterium]|nr:hypothetical protein [bacterium]